jgi:hypothetical protein
MKSLRRAAGALASLVATAASAEARDICWIDKVERTAVGVRVFFSEPRIVFVKGAVKSTVFEVDQSKPEGGSSDGRISRAKSVEAIPGDKLSTNNSHDGCTLTFKIEGNVAGLWVENWYMPPPTAGVPMKPGQQTKFIPAQK